MGPLRILVEVNVLFTLLLLPYLFFLRRESFFMLNRGWILGSAAIALLLPLLPDLPVPLVQGPSVLPGLTMGNEAEGGGSVMPWWTLLGSVYIGVVLVLLIKLGMELRAVLRMRSKGGVREAWSFMGTIMVPEGAVGPERDVIIIHESIHVRHGHSIDVLFFRILHALNWFNPLWMLALKELRMVHEHVADAAAQRACPDYGTILFAHAMGVPANSLVHAFRSSNLKTRLHMLTRKPSSRTALMKYLIAVPVILAGSLVALDGRSAMPVRTSERMATSGPDQQPEYPGGMDALVAFVGSNLKYPRTAKAAGTEGTVYVAFVIKPDGSVGEVSVKRGVSPDLDAEAMRVVKAMPNWKPGYKDGKPVSMGMTLPVTFQLEAKK